MATYYNPGLLKSQPASNGNSNSGRVDPALTAMIKNRQNAIAQSKLNSQANWKLRQAALNETSGELQTLLTAGGEEGLDTETLTASTRKIMKDYANAKIRLSQATGKYPGYESDEAYVRNTKSMIANIGDTFGSLRYTVKSYNEAMKNGPGSGPGQVDPGSIDTRFMAMNEMTKPGSNIKGRVSFDAEYNEEDGWTWYQVAKGESIRAANEAKGIEGDEYRLSYKANELFVNDPKNSKYNNLTYNTNPVVIDEPIKELLQETGVYTEDNAIDKKYDVPGKATEGGTVYNTMGVNAESLYNDLSTAALAKVYDITEATDGIMHATIKSNLKNGVEEEVIDGLNQYVYYKPSFNENGTIKTDSEGNPYKDPANKVVLGIDQLGEGQYIKNNISENGGTKALPPEQYDEFVEYIKFQMLWDAGALRKKEMTVDAMATRQLQSRMKEDRRRQGANQKANQGGDLIRTTIEAFRADYANPDVSNEQALSKLNGIDKEGIYVVTNIKYPGLIDIRQAGTGKKDKILASGLDINTDKGLNRVLLAFGINPTASEIKAVTQSGEVSDLPKQKKKDDKNKLELELQLESYTRLLKDKNDPTKGSDPLPEDRLSFESYFDSGQLDEELGITINKGFFDSDQTGNIVTVEDEEGNKTRFDPKTKKGQDTWKDIVKAQLLKKNNSISDYTTIPSFIPETKTEVLGSNKSKGSKPNEEEKSGTDGYE
jgi:hypothetical protein